MTRIIAWLSNVVRFGFMDKPEREYYELCQQRPLLTDDEFIDRHYPSGIDREVPLGVRRVVREQLNFDKIEPADRPDEIMGDLDLWELVQDVAEEFDISVDVKDLAPLDGSIDSIIWLVDKKLAKKLAEAASRPCGATSVVTSKSRRKYRLILITGVLVTIAVVAAIIAQG